MDFSKQPATIEINSDDIVEDKKTKKTKKSKKPRQPLTKKQKIILISSIVVASLLLIATIIIFVIASQKDENAKNEHPDWPDPIYSLLTGEQIASEELKTAPTYCVQTPNGMDGARPQVGLNQAGVVFEAIAEAGITRFAAIYQNSTSSMIGPIRSLRTYYLNWDTPFDCTIVHAGGAADALAALSSGGYRDLTENYTYMWRENGGNRRWNNLFTSSKYLNDFGTSKGFNTSNITGFNRMTPSEAEDKAAENLQAANPAEDATDENGNPITPIPLTTDIAINFGSIASYNTIYKYNSETNSYLRSYANGNAHMVHDCPAGLEEPNTSACGDAIQLAPKVVIAMVVQESRASDNYHENITSIGNGTAYIFQNGEIIKGTWSKKDAKSQIEFKDADGNDIKLGTGQTWIAAVPQYGSVKY